MNFCPQCGKRVEGGAAFCSNCGAKLSEQAAKPDSEPQQSYAPPQYSSSSQQSGAADGFAEKIGKLNDTPDSTSEYEPLDIESNKIMAILAYLSLLVLIPVFAAKNSPFARFHANQGLVLAIVEIIVSIAASALSFIPLLPFLLLLVNFACLVLTVIGIVNASAGRAKELPVIGKFRILK